MYKYCRRRKNIKPVIGKASRDYFLRRRKKIKRIIFFIIFYLTLAGLIYLVLFSPFLKVQKIEIIRQENIYNEITNQEIEDSVSPLLNGRKFFVFSQANLLFFPNKQAEKIIREELPVSYFKITKTITRKIKIEIKDNLPKAVFQYQNKFYYLDSRGLLVREVLAEKLDKKLPLIFFTSSLSQENNNLTVKDNLVQGQEGKPVEVKEKIDQALSLDSFLANINQEKIDFILQAFQELPQKIPGLEIISFELPDPVSSDIYVHTNKVPLIYFDQKIDFKKQIDNLILLWDKKIKEEGLEHLEYIDLRYEERIYYKEK